MRALLIDPIAKTVTEVELRERDGSFDSDHAYELMECETFTLPCYIAQNGELGSDEDHALFVDDEGLLSEPEHFFLIKAFPQPMAGKALILGPSDEEGNTLPCTIPLEAIDTLWMDRKDLKLYMSNQQAMVDRMRGDPAYDHCIFTTMKEVLG